MGLMAQSDWISLFNGKNSLDGRLKMELREYTIEGDAIVGISRVYTPNTFCVQRKSIQISFLRLKFSYHLV